MREIREARECVRESRALSRGAWADDNAYGGMVVSYNGQFTLRWQYDNFTL